ncbi:Hemolysin-type calcium-binding repeat-containing protein [Actinoplanes philippinensis]|uniref:Hemolysin-type calcium-binding repeat-containing protein n=1 Tax=Actinoplanes philippinensis TaxID=35752 RepID=A0A1I2KMI0_9ACTN|nr:calcium-binding protein [Actinoplanes philippinensis]SFF66437.1 Hemolysin-type calcium-binding repeat-containing protein [Actinoplanes philippinensis]
MNVKHRTALATLGAVTTAVASTTLVAAPAWAASAGFAAAARSTVSFRALMGQANNVSITISGRTVTLTDRVAIRPGTGCRSVGPTTVRCTTTEATATIKIALGDGNDRVQNRTGVFMLADGSTGDDTLIGGSGTDQLQGGPGADRLFGGDGQGELFGDSGADRIVGGSGYDYVIAGAGDDTITTNAGDDLIHGQEGDDTIYAGAGNDQVRGWGGNDLISGGPGKDFLMGDGGDDALTGDSDDDILVGEVYTADGDKGVSSGSEAAVDRLDAGADASVGDICLRSSTKGTATGCEWFTAVVTDESAVATRLMPAAPID